MTMTMWWILLLIIFIIVELATMGLATIWFAVGALVATLAAALNLPVWLQIVLFLAVSVVLLFFTRPIAVKYFNKDREKTNAEGLIGQQAIVISEIDNLEGVGQATVNGQEWSARSVDNDKKITVGTIVIIKEIRGVKLYVEVQNEK